MGAFISVGVFVRYGAWCISSMTVMKAQNRSLTDRVGTLESILREIGDAEMCKPLLCRRKRAAERARL